MSRTKLPEPLLCELCPAPGSTHCLPQAQSWDLPFYQHRSICGCPLLSLSVLQQIKQQCRRCGGGSPFDTAVPGTSCLTA